MRRLARKTALLNKAGGFNIRLSSETGVFVKTYLISLGVGVLVGVIYALLNVRSPAPPVVALIGLLGMLIGEQIPGLVKQVWRREPVTLSWVRRIEPDGFAHLREGEPGSQKAADEVRPDGGNPT
jgi:XapX domain-containing protein